MRQPSILFLHPYPPGTAASQRFRFEQYLEVLHSRGYRYSRQSFWPKFAWVILYEDGHTIKKAFGFLAGLLRRIFNLFQAMTYDWIFIHREVLPVGPPILEWIMARVMRKRIIYDFDDAIWIPNTSKENNWMAWIKYPHKVATICRLSYRVSVGNPYLADYARQFNPRVIINPTTIDTVNHHYPRTTRAHETLTIGWTGTHSTLRYMDWLRGVIAKISEKHTRVRWLIIADRPPAPAIPNAEFVTWSKETEIDDLARIDIGVMPLHADLWSEGKCGLKALQFMALAKPVLASPVGVNKSIVEHGVNGFLCRQEPEWIESLELLIGDPSLRSRLGAAGRTKVQDHFSVQSNTSTFLSLFL